MTCDARRPVWLSLAGGLALAMACGASAPSPAADGGQAASTSAAVLAGAVPALPYDVVRSHPHDPAAFTQGLHLVDGELFEGTGLHGRSTLRRVELRSGRVLQQVALEPRYFGEGIAVIGDRIVQLTWQSGTGFVYDRRSFERQRTFTYTGEGWGLTTDGRRLIMSDGTDTLRFWHPETLEEVGRLRVHEGGRPVSQLNELEYVNGVIYANVWPTDRVARIDPATGQVTGWLDFAGLLTPTERSRGVDVLNGLAYDPATGHLLVTGKLWPWVFEIRLADSR
jgi:glutamine cyclotransferase